MNAAREIISALVAGGMDPLDAAALVARAAVQMTASAPQKSTGATRQQRYRERHKASQTVTAAEPPQTSQTVTDRNETVTGDVSQNPPLSFLPFSDDKNSEKKEGKKERVAKKRDAPLPLDWKPSAHAFVVAAEYGVGVPAVEPIFRDYLKSSGKLYADYDAAFYNFLRNQRKFNGGSNGKTSTGNGGSIIAALDRALEQSVAEDADFAAAANPVLRLSGGSIR